MTRERERERETETEKEGGREREREREREGERASVLVDGFVVSCVRASSTHNALG